METRNRRASDAVSGLELKREEWPDYSDDEILKQFELFQQYDLDSSGFISPENMFEVLKAMEVPGISIDTVNAIIEEVAILTGHDNDGKLSFRDFMACVRYDHQAASHNLMLDAAAERRLSISEAEPAPKPVGQESTPDSVPEPEPTMDQPEPRARRSSMSAMNALASGRIKAFQLVANEAMEREKLNAFKSRPQLFEGPVVNSDDMHMETLKNKLKAFELAATFKGKTELKKTWKKVHGAETTRQGTSSCWEDSRSVWHPRRS